MRHDNDCAPLARRPASSCKSAPRATIYVRTRALCACERVCGGGRAAVGSRCRSTLASLLAALLARHQPAVDAASAAPTLVTSSARRGVGRVRAIRSAAQHRTPSPRNSITSDGLEKNAPTVTYQQSGDENAARHACCSPEYRSSGLKHDAAAVDYLSLEKSDFATHESTHPTKSAYCPSQLPEPFSAIRDWQASYCTKSFAHATVASHLASIPGLAS
mmetsp:Transcript_14482/g.47274  ORF Transcript_14482/g.47274 Transcript_14482/m.47274 type:complete len:218 (+) Transcript_14482:80-733(+)